jgi:3D (Asp-Asp-Asp) domain-containing protein
MKKTLILTLMLTSAISSSPSSHEYLEFSKEIGKMLFIKEKSREIENNKIPLNRISFYTLSSQETDNDPLTTSCGKLKEVKETVIALSRDLFFSNGKKICGKKVKIYLSNESVIEGIVYDTMHSRYSNTADILVSSRKKAFSLGVFDGYLEFLD